MIPTHYTEPSSLLDRGCCPACHPKKAIGKAAWKHNKGRFFYCRFFIFTTRCVSSLEMHLLMNANRLSQVIQQPSPAQICQSHFLFSHLHLPSTAESSNITGTNSTNLQPVCLWTWWTCFEYGIGSTRYAAEGSFQQMTACSSYSQISHIWETSEWSAPAALTWANRPCKGAKPQKRETLVNALVKISIGGCLYPYQSYSRLGIECQHNP